jgi:hypothetical protein
VADWDGGACCQLDQRPVSAILTPYYMTYSLSCPSGPWCPLL